MKENHDTHHNKCPLCQSDDSTVYHRQTENIPWRLYAPECASIGALLFYQCQTCHLIFKDPRIRSTTDQERRHYAKHNNDLSDAGYRNHLLKIVEPLIPLLPSNACGLDYGCGPIFSIEPLMRERGVSCASYDPHFFPQDGLLTPNTYDFITCSEVAEHFNFPRHEFEKLLSMLKPRGLLAVNTQLVPDTFENWWYHRDPTHVVFYSLNTFLWIAAHLKLSLQRNDGPVFILRKMD